MCAMYQRLPKEIYLTNYRMFSDNFVPIKATAQDVTENAM